MLRRASIVSRLLVPLVLIVALVAAGIATYRLMRPTVSVTNIVEGPVIRAVYATGTISPVREFPIRSSTAGTIGSVLVDKGTQVKKGQPLAVIHSPGLQYALDKAQAELREHVARADDATSPVLAEFDARTKALGELLDIARREEVRMRTMIEKGSGTQTDLDRATDRVQTYWSQLESLRAQRAAKKLELQREVAVAQAAVDTAEWNVGEQTLVSPIDGTVLDRPTSQGTRVAVNDTLLRVADVAPARLVMRASVDEEDITSVSVGQDVQMTLYAFTDRVFVGKVVTIYDEADPSRRTFEVDIALDEPDPALHPGMTGELAFVLARKDRAMILPAQALQDGHVYVVRGGRVEQASAQVGIRSVDRIEVVSGLDKGTSVVISPISADMVGRSVRTSLVDPRVAAGLNIKTDNDTFKGFR